MATEWRWRSSDGAWETAASWDVGASYPGAAVASPAVDTALFDGVSNVSLTGDLDQSAHNPLLRLITMPGYSGNLGSSGSPLLIATDSAGVGTSRIIHRGTGVIYVTGTVGQVTDVYVDSTHGYDSDCAVLDGTIRKVIVRQGRVRILGSANVNQVHVLANYGVVIMEADDGGTAPTFMVIEAGGVACYRDLSTATIVVGYYGVFEDYGRLGDSVHLVNWGIAQLKPTVAPDSSYNPAVYNDGALDQTLAVYQTDFSDLILGPNSSTPGGPLDASSISTLGTYLDARQEYP